MKNKKSLCAWCLVLIMMACSLPSFAQNTTKPANKWHILLEPYLMFPNMNGSSGLGTLPDADVKADAGEIFSHVQMGAMLYTELYKGRMAFSSDFTYMKLKQDIAGKNGILSGDATMKQLGWEVAALYKIKPWLEGGIALQLNSIGSDINLVISSPNGSQSKSKSLTETWVDPSLVARVKFPLSKNQKWLLQFRGNIGGFGIGSDFYWQTQGYVGYRFSHLFQLSAGYRVIAIDYEKGSDADRFKYDMTTFGPVLRLGFNF